ncbi:MAG: hypothetical protein ABI658_17020, partial [Acidimicrobiales bacterium]
PYLSDAQWAEPDYAYAAKYMRQIVEQPTRANERAHQAQRRITGDFGVAKSAASVAQLLATITQFERPGAPRRSLLRRALHRPS